MLQVMHAVHMNRSSVQEMVFVFQFNIYAMEHPIVKMDMTKIHDYVQLVKFPVVFQSILLLSIISRYSRIR